MSIKQMIFLYLAIGWYIAREDQNVIVEVFKDAEYWMAIVSVILFWPLLGLISKGQKSV